MEGLDKEQEDQPECEADGRVDLLGQKNTAQETKKGIYSLDVFVFLEERIR